MRDIQGLVCLLLLPPVIDATNLILSTSRFTDLSCYQWRLLMAMQYTR